jgi:carotenoid cleavage dioxygenase-like enzyme
VSVPKRGQLIGRIPKWVKGDLLMNGPGKFYYGTDVFQHLFDGSALIQKYAIAEDGEVYYQCKFLRTKSFVQVGKTDFISNLFQINSDRKTKFRNYFENIQITIIS